MNLTRHDACSRTSQTSLDSGNQQKKWTCSIKAVQEGKDPTPIGKWISKTGHARARRLGDLKERTIWVLWPAENAFFKGQITDVDAATGLHHVKYRDGMPH